MRTLQPGAGISSEGSIVRTVNLPLIAYMVALTPSNFMLLYFPIFQKRNYQCLNFHFVFATNICIFKKFLKHLLSTLGFLFLPIFIGFYSFTIFCCLQFFKKYSGHYSSVTSHLLYLGCNWLDRNTYFDVIKKSPVDLLEYVLSTTKSYKYCFTVSIYMFCNYVFRKLYILLLGFKL